MPDEYPYDVPGDERSVFRADFDDRVDVIPVSDPNVVSSTQRIALGQSVLQLVESSPGLYGQSGLREAHRSMLIALRTPNVDALLPEEAARLPRMDPVTENTKIINKQPIEAYPDQHHEAHIAVHNAVLPLLQDEGQKAALTAHNYQHMAHMYRIQIEQQLGYQLTGEEYPPEIEAQIAAQVALQTQVQPILGAPGAETGDQAGSETIAKIQRADLEAAAGIDRKDRESAAKIERDLQEDMAKAGREAVSALTAVRGIEGTGVPSTGG